MYLAEQNLGIVNWPIEGKKYVFARQLPHTKMYIYPLINVHWAFLVATWIWQWPLTEILQKGLLGDGDRRMLLLQWIWGSLGFCSVFSNNFFVATYTCLSLLLTIDFCYSQLIFFVSYFKKAQKKKKKRWNILKKMNSLKKGEGVPLLNFEVDSGSRVLVS